MKQILCSLFLLSLLLLLSSCRQEQREPVIPQSSEYLDWEQTVPVILDYPIPGHEDNRRRIFINSLGTEVKVAYRENRVDWEFCFDCHAKANEPHPYADGNQDNEFRDYVFHPYRRP